MFSYLNAKLFPVKNPLNFEDWVSNQFGKRLYRIFFKTYTEKVWGIPCSEISADWAAQRIKGSINDFAHQNSVVSAKTIRQGRADKNTDRYFSLSPPGSRNDVGNLCGKCKAYGVVLQMNARVKTLEYHGGRMVDATGVRRKLHGIQSGDFFSTFARIDSVHPTGR